MNSWISVYDMLPGYDKDVIVHVEDAKKRYVTIANISECFGWHNENGDPLKECRILHWMPLPLMPEISNA